VHILAMVSAVEKQLLVDRKHAVGARTWREFLFGVSASSDDRSVDLSKVAAVSGAVRALQSGPRSVHEASEALLRVAGRFTELMLLNPDRAELHRRSIETTLRDVRAAIESLNKVIEASELACAPPRDEITRVLKLVAGK
jgi:hypothetical protein